MHGAHNRGRMLQLRLSPNRYVGAFFTVLIYLCERVFALLAYHRGLYTGFYWVKNSGLYRLHLEL